MEGNEHCNLLFLQDNTLQHNTAGFHAAGCAAQML